VAGELYDYLIALIITGVIFASAVIVVPNVSYVNLLYVDQQQLRNVALETLKAMLLDTGYPLNWNSSNIQRFGLAYAGSSSYYVLDPDKVQQLNRENKLSYVDYDTTRRLLNLRDYGFSLSIIPTFNVTISERLFKLPDISLTVKVSRHDGRPLANAAVHTTFLYSIKEENPQKGENPEVFLNSTVAPTNFTDPLGTCEVSGTLDNPPTGFKIKDVIAVLKVTVADIATVVAVYQSVQNPEGIIDTGSVGDDLYVWIPLTEEEKRSQPQEADWVCNVAAYYGPGDIEVVYSGGTQDTDKFNWGQASPYKNWTRPIPGLKSSDPALLIYVISCVPKVEEKTLTNAPSSTLEGTWSNPAYAYASDNRYGTTATDGATQQYGNYGFSLPPDANITKVEVGFEAYTDEDEKIGITCSWDGGTTWAKEDTSKTLPTSDPNTLTWSSFNCPGGWTVDKLSDAKFRIQVKGVKNGKQMSTIYLDQIPVRVTYELYPVGGGRRPVLLAGPSPIGGGFRVLNYGGTPRGTTVRVQRNVIISGMTYIAEMILWKESL